MEFGGFGSAEQIFLTDQTLNALLAHAKVIECPPSRTIGLKLLAPVPAGQELTGFNSLAVITKRADGVQILGVRYG